jgi:hypothetical protein
VHAAEQPGSGSILLDRRNALVAGVSMAGAGLAWPGAPKAQASTVALSPLVAAIPKMVIAPDLSVTQVTCFPL